MLGKNGGKCRINVALGDYVKKDSRGRKRIEREVRSEKFSVSVTPSVKRLLEIVVIETEKTVPELIAEWIRAAARALGLAEHERQVATEPKTQEFTKFCHVVLFHMAKLVESGKFSHSRLKELMGGHPPTEVELLRVALICGLSEDYLANLPINGESHATFRAE